MRDFAQLNATQPARRLIGVAILLAVCCALAACGSPSVVGSTPTATPTTRPLPSSSPTPTPTGQPLPQSIVLNFLHMVDAQQDWAAGYNLVLRTADGGTHWRDVTPAGCRTAATSDINSVAVLDALSLWFVCQQGSATGGQQTFVLFHTVDGGRDWQTMSPHLQPGISVVGLTFLDANHGWFDDSQGSASGHHFLVLYGTSDGGATWHAVTQTDQPNSLESAALGGGPVFLSATTGWFGSDIGGYTSIPNQFALWVTQDGGTTWHQQTLPPPNGQVVGATAAPTCFNALQCAIILEPTAVPSPSPTSPPQPYLLLYVSGDGGQTWTPEPLVALQVVNVAFLDLHVGWAVVDPNPPGVSACNSSAAFSWTGQSDAIPASSPLPNVLEGTTDGGRHWTTLNSTVDWCSLQALDFVSPQLGWALSGSQGSATKLLRTTDGGASWTQVPWQSA